MESGTDLPACKEKNPCFDFGHTKGRWLGEPEYRPFLLQASRGTRKQRNFSTHLNKHGRRLGSERQHTKANCFGTTQEEEPRKTPHWGLSMLYIFQKAQRPAQVAPYSTRLLGMQSMAAPHSSSETQKRRGAKSLCVSRASNFHFKESCHHF